MSKEAKKKPMVAAADEALAPQRPTLSTPSGRLPPAYVKLSPEPIRFEPVDLKDEVKKVCYDEVNGHVFVVKKNYEVVRVLPTRGEAFRIKFSNGNALHSLRFSLDVKTLAIRRTTRSLSFISFEPGTNQNEFTQPCKMRSTAQLRDFFWTGNKEIVYVTSHGLELYSVNTAKRSAKLLKSIGLSVSFSVYCPACRLLVVASTLEGNVLYPFFINNGTVIKVPKILIELPLSPSSSSTLPKFTAADIYASLVYGEPYIFVSKNNPVSFTGHKAEIVMYKVQRDGVLKTHVLALPSHGRFMINVVDDVIIVHRQASQETYAFDILFPHQRVEQSFIPGAKSAQQYVGIHKPVCAPASIPSVEIDHLTWNKDVRHETVIAYAYSKNWIAFLPNVIIDPKLGALWQVELSLSDIPSIWRDKEMLFDFLLRRRGTKGILLAVLNACVAADVVIDTAQVGALFDIINKPLSPPETDESEVVVSVSQRSNSVSSRRRNTASVSKQPSSSSSSSSLPSTSALLASRSSQEISLARIFSGPTIQYQRITQGDIMKMFLVPLRDREDIDSRTFIALVLEYVRSLTLYNIPVEHHIYELVIASLVREEKFHQLHQFLQYHVIDDSKPVACLLLGLERQYPPALQLALDMFKRLGNSQEEIFHVLLSEQQYLSALRFIRRLGKGSKVVYPGSRILQTALDAGKTNVFIAAYKYFTERQSDEFEDFEEGQFARFTGQFKALVEEGPAEGTNTDELVGEIGGNPSDTATTNSSISGSSISSSSSSIKKRRKKKVHQ